MSAFTQRRTVEFHETDMAGIAHFSNFFRWMEAAENAFLLHCGVAVVEKRDNTFRGWPRVRASAKYQAPVRFGDTIEVQLDVTEIKDRAVEYAFTIVADPDHTAIKAATGKLTTVYAEIPADSDAMRAVTITDAIRSALTR